MSDFTDDVMDGMFCQFCGSYLDGECGYPRACAECAAYEKKAARAAKKPPKPARRNPS